MVGWGNCHSLQLPEHVTKRPKPPPGDTEHLASWWAATIAGLQAEGHPAASQQLLLGCSQGSLLALAALRGVFLSRTTGTSWIPRGRVRALSKPLGLLLCVHSVAVSPCLVALHTIHVMTLSNIISPVHTSPLNSRLGDPTTICHLHWSVQQVASSSSPTLLLLPRSPQPVMATPSFQVLSLKLGCHPWLIFFLYTPSPICQQILLAVPSKYVYFLLSWFRLPSFLDLFYLDSSIWSYSIWPYPVVLISVRERAKVLTMTSRAHVITCTRGFHEKGTSELGPEGCIGVSMQKLC